MSVPNFEQLKSFTHRLDELLTSSQSWGEFAHPLDRSLEILRGLLQLTSSFPALKTSHEVLYQNANRLFENGIGIIANIAQLQAGILQGSAQPQVNVAENSAQFQAIVGNIFAQRQEIEEDSAQCHSRAVDVFAQEELYSLLCLLQEFLPEPKSTEDLFLRVGRTDLQMDSLCECHLARHLRVIINVMNSIHELLVFLKSVFVFSSGVSISMQKFTRISSKLEEIVSVLAEANVVASCPLFGGIRFLSIFFKAVDKPFKIAMNALWLLFLLTTIEFEEFETFLMLCRSTARILVCSTAILNDFTQIFLKDFTNFNVLRDELAQRIKVLLKCVLEMFPPKVNGVTVFQNMCNFRPNNHIIVKSISNKCSAIVPQNQVDSKDKNLTFNASAQIAKNLNGSLVPQNLGDIECNGGDVSVISTNSICDVVIPQSLQGTKYKNSSRQLSKNMNSVTLAPSLYSSKSHSDHTSVQLTKNICDSSIPSGLRTAKDKNVDTSMQPTEGSSGVIVAQSLCNTKFDSGDTSVKSTKNVCDIIAPVRLLNSKDKDVSMQSTKNVNGSIVAQTLQNTKCDSANTPIESTKNMNDVDIAQTLCNIKCNSGDIFSDSCDAPVTLSLQNTKYTNVNALMQSTKNMNDITRSLCNIRCNTNTLVQFRSIPMPINWSEDVAAVLKTIFAILTFSQNSVDAGLNTIGAGKQEVNPVLNKLYFSSQYRGTWGIKTCSVTSNQKKELVKLINKSNKLNNLVLFSVKVMESELQVLCKVCDTTALMQSTATSAHFFANSLEVKFASPKVCPKQSVYAPIADLKDKSFLSIKNKPNLLFFCTTCGISVALNEVSDHVQSREHLLSMAQELLNKKIEQNITVCGNVEECENPSLFSVCNKRSKDSCAIAVAKNLARAQKIRSRSWAGCVSNLREKIPEPQSRAVSLSEEPGKGVFGKFLNMQGLEALDSSFNHVEMLMKRHRGSLGKISVGPNKREIANSHDCSSISSEVVPYTTPKISSPAISQNVLVPTKSNSCAQNILRSVSQNLTRFTSQNFKQNTTQNSVQCSLQNCAYNTARSLAESESENFESALPDLNQGSICVEHDSFCRIFDALSLEDKQTVRNIVWQIRDEINNFALSNKPGTSKLRIVCKVCCHPMRPQKVVSHVSKPTHLKKLEQSRNFCVMGVKRPVEADGAI